MFAGVAGNHLGAAFGGVAFCRCLLKKASAVAVAVAVLLSIRCKRID